MADTDEAREALIAEGIDPDTEGVHADVANLANKARGTAPEAYLPRGKSSRHLSPMSPDYDQERTPWNETDRNLVY